MKAWSLFQFLNNVDSEYVVNNIHLNSRINFYKNSWHRYRGIPKTITEGSEENYPGSISGERHGRISDEISGAILPEITNNFWKRFLQKLLIISGDDSEGILARFLDESLTESQVEFLDDKDSSIFGEITAFSEYSLESSLTCYLSV